MQDRRFWNANTPGSEGEGHYVSPSEMADLMAPHDDTLDALRSVRRGAARCAHGPISLCSFHIVCVLCVVCCVLFHAVWLCGSVVDR